MDEERNMYTHTGELDVFSYNVIQGWVDNCIKNHRLYDYNSWESYMKNYLIPSLEYMYVEVLNDMGEVK